MSDARPTLSSWISAAGLAVVTIFVFYTLRDYGPESAIRRFHTAAVTSNAEEINQVSFQDLRSIFTQTLSSDVYQLINISGARYQILYMVREPNVADAWVVYTLPDNRKVQIIWVVEKHDLVWKINTERTLRTQR